MHVLPPFPKTGSISENLISTTSSVVGPVTVGDMVSLFAQEFTDRNCLFKNRSLSVCNEVEC